MLVLVADGLTAAAVARRLVVAERTVHKHLERAYAKLGVSDRVTAVLRAQRLGILPEPALPWHADRPRRPDTDRGHRPGHRPRHRPGHQAGAAGRAQRTTCTASPTDSVAK